MLNNFGENIFSANKKTKLGIITLTTLFSLSGCGSSGTNNGNNNGGGDSLPNIAGKLVGKSQIGIVEGANISIETSNGKVLYTTVTDNNGNYEIDKEEFNQILENNGLNKDSELYVFSRGGIDLDPYHNGNKNDDSDKSINGEMVNFLSYNEINGSYTTPITTYIFDLIKNDSNNFSDIKNSYGILDSTKLKKIIDETLVKIGAIDINRDGKIDKKDLIRYDMVLNKSNLETAIETSGFYDNIYSGMTQDESTINAVKNIINNLSITKINYDFSGPLKLENPETEGYASPELKSKKDKLEGELTTLEKNLSNKNTKLLKLKTIKTELDNNIINNSSDLITRNNDLNTLNNFKKNVGEISFSSEPDDTVKTKIDNVPDISSISINIPQKSNILRGISSYSSENTDKISTTNLDSRKSTLKSEIDNITKEIEKINNDIQEKKEELKVKENEIQKEEDKLKTKQDKVDKVESELEKFKKDNKDEIAEYRQSVKDYNSGLQELENLGVVKNLYLDIGYITKRKGPTNAINVIKDRQNQIKLPQSSDYILDSNTKEYSDLFTFKEEVMNLFGNEIEAEIQYGYKSDYPAKIRFVTNYGVPTEGFNNIKNKEHKRALIKYVGARAEKEFLINKLEKLEGYEVIRDNYATLLSILADIELDLDGTIDEYNDLKKSIQPTIDNLNELKRELEYQKRDLENDKNKKENLEDKKKKLIDLLNDLKIKISDFNTKKPLVESEINTLTKEKDSLSEQNKENNGLIVTVNNDKNTINIEIGNKQTELNGVNSEIDENSDMKSSLTTTVSLYGKDFRLTVNSDKVGGESVEELKQKLINHIKKNTKGNWEKFGDTQNSSYYHIYYINGDGKFPAYIWGGYKLYNEDKKTKVYTVKSKTEKDNFIDKLNGNILKNILYNNSIEKHIVDKLFTNSSIHNPKYVFKYKEIIKYFYNNIDDKYPAKVGINVSLGSQSVNIESDILANNKEEEKNILKNLIDNIENNNKIEKVVSEIGVNEGQMIWVDGKKVPMIGGAYNIYKINGIYIGTYKVANRGEWHIGGVWKDLNGLELEINRISDSWAERNGKDPVVENVDRSDSGVIESEKIEKDNIGNDNNDNFNLPEFESEYNELYSELYMSCQEKSYQQYPLTGGNGGNGALLDNGKNQIEYTNTCLLNTLKQEELKEKTKGLFESFSNVLKIQVDSIVGSYNIGKGFLNGYGSAIYSQGTYLSNLDDEELKKIKDDTLKSLDEIKEYIESIGGYWSASIGYQVTKDPNLLIIKNNLASKISFGPEIKELEEMLSQIEWDYIEDKEYWSGYIGGYMTEYMVVGKAVGMSSKGYATEAKNQIKNIINKLNIGSKTGKILNKSIKIDRGVAPVIFGNLLTKKTYDLYKNINGVDDILKISKGLHINVGTYGGAINVPLNGKSADVIIDILSNKGWKKTNTLKNIDTFMSANGLEKINIRTISSSSSIYQGNGYNVEKTIDLIKNSKNEFRKFKEIKFIKIN